jgi:hypothetical protein
MPLEGPHPSTPFDGTTPHYNAPVQQVGRPFTPPLAPPPAFAPSYIAAATVYAARGAAILDLVDRGV